MKFGLAGTVTSDLISYESGRSFEGKGGILYQAAALCGLGEEVILYTQVGSGCMREVDKIIRYWPTLDRRGIREVPGPGNVVHLLYPERGERIEVLKSVVPPLDPSRIFSDLKELDMLVVVFNSGYDIAYESWREIVLRVECPLWLDIHSLALAKSLNRPREYASFPQWKDWVQGVDFLQANKKEIACMLEHPGREPSREELESLGNTAFHLGVEAVYATLGAEGVLVMTPEEKKLLSTPGKAKIVDTTGCGDVFCAGTASKLAEGADPFEAALFGTHLATKAAGSAGVEETFTLATRAGRA